MAEAQPSLGCARCGDCCDPVLLGPNAIAVIEGEVATGLDADDETITFAREHWRRRGELDGDGWGRYDCDQFDPELRLCSAGDARPPVCRYYPWYADGPTSGRAATLHPRCSYLAEVPPEQRPEGSRPLIPIEAIRR